jgi:hypothetical protein
MLTLRSVTADSFSCEGIPLATLLASGSEYYDN